MEPKTERTRAMEFFSKLRFSLQREIRRTGINPLPQTRQGMLSLATRLWENIKHEEKEPLRKENKRSPNEGKSASANEGSSTASTKKQRGPKEYASGVNNKGQRICFTCGSTEHLAWHHKKDKDDKGDTEQKRPGVHVVKIVGQKRGQERKAEKAWDSLSDSSDDE